MSAKGRNLLGRLEDAWVGSGDAEGAHVLQFLQDTADSATEDSMRLDEVHRVLFETLEDLRNYCANALEELDRLRPAYCTYGHSACGLDDRVATHRVRRPEWNDGRGYDVCPECMVKFVATQREAVVSVL